MALRKRQKQRILIILVVLVVGAMAAAAAYRWRQHTHDETARDWRTRGIAALEAGEYEKALNGLGRFLRRLGDAEATGEDYHRYALACREVPSPNNNHLAGAISALQRALQLSPGTREVQDDLLELYLRVGFQSEALELIDDMTRAKPDDVELLALRSDLLLALGKLDAALAAANSLNADFPEYFPGFLRTAQLLVKLQRPVSEIESWVGDVVAAHDGNPRFELLRAIVFVQLARIRHGDLEYLERANRSLDLALEARDEFRDGVAVSAMVGVLDGVGRYDDAMAVLEAASKDGDDRTRVEYTRRLWYSRQGSRIPDVIESWAAAGLTIAPESQVVGAVALRAAGRGADADEALLRLSESPSNDAQVWARFGQLFTAGSFDGEAVSAARSAIATSPDCALLHYWLGNLLAPTDVAVAREHWKTATGLAPSWGEPLRRIAASLIGTERQLEAPRYAEMALARSPDARTAATLADAWVANAGRLDPGARDALQRQLDAWRASADDQLASHFESLQAALDANSESQAARGRLERLLSDSASSSEATLLRLAMIAAEDAPELAEQFVDSSEAAHGVTPRLALARGLLVARNGKPEAGVRAFDADRKRAKPDSSPLAWSIMRASLLERLSLPEAGPEWLALADEHTDSLPVQIGCLGSARAWDDREGIGRVIDRVEALTGDDVTTWRIARGRWLLMDPHAQQEDLALAVKLLSNATRLAPDSIDAHMNLARALERVGGNLDGAEAEYRKASELSPENVGIQLELARVTARRGRATESRAALESILEAGDLTTSQLVDAAILLAAQGDYRGGTDVLASRVTLDEAPRHGLVALASLYRQLGEYEQALSICDRLLERPELDVLELAADLNAALGRDDRAAVMMSRIAALPVARSTKALAKARHLERWGTFNQASSAHWEAVNAAPDNEAVWAALLEFVVASGSVRDMARILDDPRAASVETLAFVLENPELVQSALPSVGLRPLLLDATRMPESRPQLLKALRLIVGDGEVFPPIAELAPEVRALASAHPDLLSLQLVAAELVTRAGDDGPGIDISRRAAAQFPRSTLAARQLAILLAGAGRWDEAIDAGLDWRERAPREAVAIDAFIGNAMMHSGRIGDALIQYERNLEAAEADPDAHSNYLAAYAVARVRSGDTERAETWLAPLVTGHAGVGQALLAVRPSEFADGASCKQWLDMVERLVPAEDAAIRSVIALRWATAFELHGGDDIGAEAAEHITAAAGRDDATAQDLFVAGYFAERHGDHEAAESAYRQALVVDEGFVAARNNLAMLLVQTGRPDEAVQQARRALEHAPASSDVLDTLGITLRAAGKLTEARQRFEEALSRAPNNTAFMLNLAETLHELGEVRACRARVIRIVELEEREPQLDDEARARLDSLREALRDES